MMMILMILIEGRPGKMYALLVLLNTQNVSFKVYRLDPRTRFSSILSYYSHCSLLNLTLDLGFYLFPRLEPEDASSKTLK